MSRKSRILLSNACYHIITRGNQRQKIFPSTDDFSHYINFLWKYKRKFNAKIYAYCLMSSHTHLLVDPVDNLHLKKFMHGINMSYAKYFNYKYDKCGHLWQDRFKSFIISKDSYILNCINYIEYNPIRTHVVDKPEDYTWSSYKARIFGAKDKIFDVFELV